MKKLAEMTKKELYELAKEKNVSNRSNMKKEELLNALQSLNKPSQLEIAKNFIKAKKEAKNNRKALLSLNLQFFAKNTFRTTKKEFKEQIQQHILERLDEDFSTVETQLKNVIDCFKDWYSPYERKMTPNRQEAFTSFLKGLPSCLNQEFSYHGIYTTLKSWYENCEQVYIEQESDKESNLYYHLIYREFNNLCKKYNVDFPLFY